MRECFSLDLERETIKASFACREPSRGTEAVVALHPRCKLSHD
jgi:hypothetical protein